MVIQGHRVSFLMIDPRAGEEELHAPPSWHLVRDPTGRRMRKCDVLILPLRRQVSLRDVSEDDRAAAEAIYGERSNLSRWQVYIPSPDWFYIGRVSNLLYTRESTEGGPDWDHEFSSPQRLYEHRTLPAWRFRFAEDCVVDDFFRHP